jgi:hypothetical protein
MTSSAVYPCGLACLYQSHGIFMSIAYHHHQQHQEERKSLTTRPNVDATQYLTFLFQLPTTAVFVFILFFVSCVES